MPVVSLLIILTLSLLVTRVAAVGLMHTGLSREAARFQARSAFTGVGFTTGESEKIVNHPVRRRIVMLLMLVGNAGFITVISTSMLTFMTIEDDAGIKIGLLVAGLALLWLVASSRWVDGHLSRAISMLLRRYTTLDVRDYANLLQVGGEYRVTELKVGAEDWLAHRTLLDLSLRDEGVMVLGINRADGEYLGAPRGTTEIQSGDTIILYGKIGMCERLDQRRSGHEGEAEHRAAVEEEQRRVEQEQVREAVSS